MSTALINVFLLMLSQLILQKRKLTFVGNLKLIP